jgi:hypothetical protein
MIKNGAEGRVPHLRYTEQASDESDNRIVVDYIIKIY